MEGIGKDAVQLLQYLLPGFLAAWVFYGLTPYEWPSQFERVIQALILTLLIQTFVVFEKFALDWMGRPWTWSVSDQQSHLIASTVTSLVVGVVFSLLANHDLLHRGLRAVGITRETSFPSEWFGCFHSDVTYVVLQLKDDRRIYGWPREWPSDPKEGHFALQEPSWLLDDGTQRVLEGVTRILISVADVEWVRVHGENMVGLE